jgi:EAL domain-containing protein (putative c-di-GMP-specific phosphodiesterase class I)
VSNLTRDDGPFLAIVEAVTKLGEKLGIRIIAEGVETQAQRRLLLDIGCSLGQGYLFSRPQRISTLVSTGQSPSPPGD